MSRPFLTARRAILVGGAVTLCVGCGASPDLDKELDAVRSWTATARLAVDVRRAGATTATYTRQLRDRAAQALDEERRQIVKAERTPKDLVRARPALDSLAQAVRALGAVDEAAGR